MGRESIIDGKKVYEYERQADATLSQASPTADTLYTLLDTTIHAKIISIVASVTWSGQPTPLEVIVTIDGQTINYSFTNPVSATNYIPTESVASMALAESAQVLATTLSATVLMLRQFTGRSIKIQLRTGHTTAGTVSNLSGRCKYAKIP